MCITRTYIWCYTGEYKILHLSDWYGRRTEDISYISIMNLDFSSYEVVYNYFVYCSILLVNRFCHLYYFLLVEWTYCIYSNNELKKKRSPCVACLMGMPRSTSFHFIYSIIKRASHLAHNNNVTDIKLSCIYRIE